ncbi:MAG: mevalonate kinase [Candidatus Asgardarchaeum californiense]|nr:MAG: mevalonate kinase [Candidatus Asgardarchaeum californiense]
MPGHTVSSAPGKIILFGEHSVVYGHPAIVGAINLRAKSYVKSIDDKKIEIFSKNYGIRSSFSFTELDDFELRKDDVLLPVAYSAYIAMSFLDQKKGLSITIDSDIPKGAGLGSSASVAVATIHAVSTHLGYQLKKEEISKLAYEAEKLVHGTPSGIDNTAATFGGLIYFRKPNNLQRVTLSAELNIIIGDTGVSRQTKVLVAKVRQLLSKYPNLINSILNTMGNLAELALTSLKNNDLLSVGALMNINQGLLYSIGVSHEKLDNLIYAALHAGAIGAKLTGAGGGGCMFALVTPKNINKVAQAIQEHGGQPYITSLTTKGVTLENSDNK